MNTSTEDVVRSTVDRSGCLTVVLNRPKHAHALNEEVLDRLLNELRKAHLRDVNGLVVTSTGRHFCSGFDLSDLDSLSHQQLVYRFILIQQVLEAVRSAPCATVAFVRGAAFGAGADLALACQCRIGLEEAAFRFPGYQFGVSLGTRRLVSIVGAERAERVLLGNERLDAHAALQCGLLTHVVSSKDADAVVHDALAEGLSMDREARESLFRHTRLPVVDAELAELVRSVSRPGLKERIVRYRELARSANAKLRS